MQNDETTGQLPRYGKFYVAGKLVHEQPEVLAKVLALMEFVPMRVEHMAMQGLYEYAGQSKLFGQLGVGYRVPEYQISISAEDGEVSDVHAHLSSEQVPLRQADIVG